MFRSLGDLMGASMIATDGGIGRICNFLFDDELWKIRYCVVDVGHWLARREVLISMSAIDRPDWKTKTLRARLTKEQLRNGPDVDSKKPVSRQQEIAMREYFGWPAYWDTVVDKVFPPNLIPAGREFGAGSGGLAGPARPRPAPGPAGGAGARPGHCPRRARAAGPGRPPGPPRGALWRPFRR